MGLTPYPSLATLPSAFAAACRLSRTEGELFERCRIALVRRFQSERIWFTLTSPTEALPRVGPAAGFEDALGMAATQSCGLMSAQFESMVKRMQHGFASRNGLTAAALAAPVRVMFERTLRGFLTEEAQLVGVETRLQAERPGGLQHPGGHVQ